MSQTQPIKALLHCAQPKIELTLILFSPCGFGGIELELMGSISHPQLWIGRKLLLQRICHTDGIDITMAFDEIQDFFGFLIIILKVRDQKYSASGLAI